MVANSTIKHVHREEKYVIENMVIVLQNNCTTKIMRIVLIVLTSIMSFTYTNITF